MTAAGNPRGDDPVAAVDEMVARVDPKVASPGVEDRDVVLVSGAWLAGSTSLLTALRDRLADHTFVEADELGPRDAPTAVLFVVSGIAPITQSDCELLDFAAKHTDLVVGVVAKIDRHRDWRDVLAANRERLTAHAPRYRDVPWVGTAAAPDLGEPVLDELVELLWRCLADPDTKRRNRLRAWETRLQDVISRHESDGAGSDRTARVAVLHERRTDITRQRRLAKSERNIALRSQIQQARVQLTYFARKRCASVRGELQEDASETTRRRLSQFEADVRGRVDEVVDEVDQGITKHLAEVAIELGLAAPGPPQRPGRLELSPPALKSRRLETRLMMVLGAGFGLGVALGVSRLFAGLAPGLTISGLVAGGLAGLLVMVWLVGIRRLLHDRAVLDRWVVEATTELRALVEELVATRVVAAETALTAELATREEADAEVATGRVDEIDAELREHAVGTARAAALRDRRLPALLRALAVVQRELSPTAASVDGVAPATRAEAPTPTTGEPAN